MKMKFVRENSGPTHDVSHCKMSEMSDDMFFFASNEEAEIMGKVDKVVVAGCFGSGPSLRWQPISWHHLCTYALRSIKRRTKRVRYLIIEMDRAWEGEDGPYWRHPPTAGKRYRILDRRGKCVDFVLAPSAEAAADKFAASSGLSGHRAELFIPAGGRAHDTSRTSGG